MTSSDRAEPMKVIPGEWKGRNVYLVDRLNRIADRVNRGDEKDGTAVAETMYEAASRIRTLEDALYRSGITGWEHNHEAGDRAKAIAGDQAADRFSAEGREP